jgi:hypothetical protein
MIAVRVAAFSVPIALAGRLAAVFDRAANMLSLTTIGVKRSFKPERIC